MSDLRPIVFAGGGTGGHVFPGLAVAEELRRRAPRRPIEWIGAAGGIEERVVPRAGLPLVVLPMAGLARIDWRRRAVAIGLAFAATVRLLSRFSDVRPALLVGVGGFASGPAVLAALFVGVPTLLLEQNAVAGATNRVLSRFVGAIAASFEESTAGLAGRVFVCGNPVRAEIAAIAPRAQGPVRNVLAFGGSRGARALNELWIGALPSLAALPVRFVLQTGADDEARVRDAAVAAGADAEVLSFIDDMPRRLAEADLVVARAGATTVAELAAAGRGSILVPLPTAANDHQRANARALERRGAAIVLEQQALDPVRFAALIEELVRDPERAGALSAAARRGGRPDAAARVADLAEGLSS